MRAHGPFLPLLRTRVRLSRAFGVTPARRAQLLRSMVEGHARSAATYWLQLALATGIAILGLALDNTGVVIGAMLVSPLMGPIVGLGMGLAVGSALIVLRSLLRVLWSLLAVTAGAALITVALPFHEVTREIASRTAPNALDLLVAAFCAVAGALTTVRASSDSATAAAGTAIAIALVPPLCVVGFGLGTADRAIAGGASMLFVANFCAILLVAVLTFLAFGFTSRTAEAIAAAVPADAHLVGRAARGLQSLFGSRYSPVLRVAMPAVLLALVYVPLRRALGEVSWQVRTRSAIERHLRSPGVADKLVRSSVQVERSAVALELLVVGSARDARDLERNITGWLAKATSAPARVRVRAVPDHDEITATVRVAPAPPPLVASTPSDWTAVEREVTEALEGAWPGDAGARLRWRIEPRGPGAATLEVLHLGPALGGPAEALLGTLLGRDLHLDLRLRTIALPPVLEEIAAPTSAPSPAWLIAALGALEQARGLDGLAACVTAPPPPRAIRRRPPTDDAAPARAALLAALARLPADRTALAEGTSWRLALRPGGCAAPAAP